MPLNRPHLWRRLAAHEYDARKGTAPFSVKLAYVENRTDDYSARVIDEYRKYLYLTQVRKGEVTPSLPVDWTWHMHLTYTKDYWDVLCGKVIGKPVHHNPREGEEEMARYLSQYQATKALYEREFDAEPPVDIWPAEATDDPLTPIPLKGGGVLVMIFVAAVAVLLARAFDVLSIPFIIPMAVMFAVGGYAIYFEAKRQPKHRRKKADDDGDTGVWFHFEYGRRGRDDDGDGGDGDGGGCCD